MHSQTSDFLHALLTLSHSTFSVKLSYNSNECFQTGFSDNLLTKDCQTISDNVPLFRKNKKSRPQTCDFGVAIVAIRDHK